MISIRGLFYDGKTARPTPAVAQVYDNGELTLVPPLLAGAIPLARVRMSARIANTPRHLYFPNGENLETQDNETIDALIARYQQQRFNRFLFLLETKKSYVFVALLVVLLSAWLVVQYGIPSAAKYIAFALPARTNQLLGQGTLEIMDKQFFSPSRLDNATRARINHEFMAIAAGDQRSSRYRLVFRQSDRIGANAFALPSGIVVITDGLVRLSHDDREIIAVLAHEVGHVHYRHGLRSAIQGSVIALLTVMITGDTSSTSALLAALPTWLIDAHYSQAFEREADDYSLAYLMQHHIDPIYFKNLMVRLEAQHGKGQQIPAYLSSHPPTAERIGRFEQAHTRLLLSTSGIPARNTR